MLNYVFTLRSALLSVYYAMYNEVKFLVRLANGVFGR